jgi:hypothetical protein
VVIVVWVAARLPSLLPLTLVWLELLLGPLLLLLLFLLLPFSNDSV